MCCIYYALDYSVCCIRHVYYVLLDGDSGHTSHHTKTVGNPHVTRNAICIMWCSASACRYLRDIRCIYAHSLFRATTRNWLHRTTQPRCEMVQSLRPCIVIKRDCLFIYNIISPRDCICINVEVARIAQEHLLSRGSQPHRVD